MTLLHALQNALTSVFKIVLPLMTQCFSAGNIRQSIHLCILFSPSNSFAKPVTLSYSVLLHLIYNVL